MAHHITLGVLLSAEKSLICIGRNSAWDCRSVIMRQDSVMILEVAILDVREGACESFESDFHVAEKIISSIPGYLSHELQRCIEKTARYILLVRWESLEAHTMGFRQSPQYQEWKRLLHHYYDPFPTVEHYQKVEMPGA
jgi:heme-degrading monooxygenase HmoA